MAGRVGIARVFVAIARRHMRGTLYDYPVFQGVVSGTKKKRKKKKTFVGHVDLAPFFEHIQL